MLEQRLDGFRRSGYSGDLRIEVTAADRPVLAFLAQQAAPGEAAGADVVHLHDVPPRAGDPDFVRLRERNRRVRVLQTSFGAVLGTHQISPFILLGRLAQLKKPDPDYVCLCCQGTDADEKPITFCSRCGERLDESVLRICPKCTLDLRSLLGEVRVWNEIEAPPEPSVREPGGMRVDTVLGNALGNALDNALDNAAAPGDPAAAPPDRSPGWYPDPWAHYEVRFWDGARWTMNVGSGGVGTIDAREEVVPPAESGPLPVPPPPSDDATHVKRPF